MPPHVTLLFPFVPVDEVDGDAVGKIFEAVGRFEFALRRVGVFSTEDVVYLAPEPPTPFARLTRALVECFPEYQPYDGGISVEAIVPHLTLVQTEDAAIRAEAIASVPKALPIVSNVSEAWLMHEVNGRWQRHTPFRLGH